MRQSFSLLLPTLLAFSFIASPIFWQPAQASNAHGGKTVAQARFLAKQVVEAFGGEDNLRQSNEVICSSTGRIKEFSMLSGTTNSADCHVFSRGRKERIEITVLGQQIITGFNGKDSWIQQGDEVHPTDATTAKRVREEVERGLALIDKFTNKKLHISLGPAKMVQGKNCQCLVVQGKDGKPTNFYVDPDNHLITRTEYSGTDLEQGLDTYKAFEYSDYRQFNGCMMPYKTEEFNGKKESSQSIVTEVEIAQGVDDSIFEMPAETELARLKAGVIEVPFEYRDNEIFVKAKINDDREVEMIFDTGATQTVIDEKKANLFGEVKESDLRMTTGSGSVQANYLKLHSLSLGELVLKDVTVAISPLSGFDQIYGKKPVGLLGANIMHRFRVTIDYPKRLITFSDPKSPYVVPHTAVRLTTKPALGTSGLLVEGTLDGQPLNFLVDSGAAFSNVSEELVREIIPHPLLPVGKVLGLDGVKVSIGSVMFKSLKLANKDFSRVIFSVAPHSVTPAQSGIIANGALAILGNPFWSPYAMTIDYRNQRLILDQSQSKAVDNSVLEEIAKIQLRMLKTGDKETARHKLKNLAHSFEKAKPGAAAICYCRAAAVSAAPYGQETSDMLKKALSLATTSGDKEVRAEVCSTSASLHFNSLEKPEAKELKDDGLMICKAAEMAPTNSAVALALYGFLIHSNSKNKMAEPIIDQILLLDPSNWDALWARYDAAKAADNQSDMVKVSKQLQFYYHGVAKVDELSTSAQ